MNPVVVTYASDPAHPGLANLIKSCQRWGWKLHLVHGEWKGWGHRLKRVLAQSGRLFAEGFTHLIHLDAYDCLAVGPASAFEEAMGMDDFAGRAYAANYARLILAAEIGCWPDAELRHRDLYKNASIADPWQYAHSQFVLDLTAKDLPPTQFGQIADEYDDQLHCHDVYLSEPMVRLDRECHLIQSTAFCHPWYAYFEVRPNNPQGILHNRLTDSWPLFAHFNGKTEMDWLLPHAV